MEKIMREFKNVSSFVFWR